MKAIVVISASMCLLAVAGGGWAAMRTPDTAAATTPASAWAPDDPDLGAKAYTMCQACHGMDGRGVPGYAPALAGSPWLVGDARAAILIVLHGYDATSEPGAAYVSSRMLGHGQQLADHEIAGVLTWTRARWGNRGAAVTRDDVTRMRMRFSGRSTPWTPAELRAIVAEH